MHREIFGMVMGVLIVIPLVVMFNPHLIVCFFLGMFATGFWQNIYGWIVPERTIVN